MKLTVTEIVDVILRKICETPNRQATENGIRSWLKRQGYNQREIEAAMKLVLPFFVSGRTRPDEHRPDSTRALSIYEEHKLSPEARNALARLELYGLISSYEREAILERLGQFEGEVGLEELDYLLSWLVCTTRDVESQQSILRAVDSERTTFH
jgi:uncharacterized protein Smg (DUF494 family)